MFMFLAIFCFTWVCNMEYGFMLMFLATRCLCLSFFSFFFAQDAHAAPAPDDVIWQNVTTPIRDVSGGRDKRSYGCVSNILWLHYLFIFIFGLLLIRLLLWWIYHVHIIRIYIYLWLFTFFSLFSLFFVVVVRVNVCMRCVLVCACASFTCTATYQQ